MLKLIILGVIAGGFFSSTFVLNELMASQGGHWFWSASLRYVFMSLIISLMVVIKSGMGTLMDLCRLFWANWRFYCAAGSVGFGGFYALLCFGADYAPGWVIAATFQFTAVASLIILGLLGERLGAATIGTSLLIFLGVILTNIGEGLHSPSSTPLSVLLLYGALPALAAGFCFPIGNQMLWYATRTPSDHVWRRRIPHLTNTLIANPLHKVWLLSVGSLPFWLILSLWVQPPILGISQAFNALLVALFAGVIATSIFLLARSQANNSGQVAAVDATQATEVIFSLIGGMILLGTPIPPILSWAGIIMVTAGLVLFSRMQQP
ncbi:multidrug resistance efflux transporter family protein [Moraxella canis]|uniref:Multidrug resistance efflux transporter family protein n=1 Tax=Moraxella canis TaxID=90239 RepID=A0A1S9ZQA9_9GAMM|nr:multidrug resistance efflux transporter family protein [Moraxella canis]OOR85530.1 hypothetical protein B0180_01715 [Moraxella canis]